MSSTLFFGIEIKEVDVGENVEAYLWVLRYGTTNICNSLPYIKLEECLSSARAFIYNFHSPNVTFNFVDPKIPIREIRGDNIEKECNSIIKKIRFDLRETGDLIPVISRKGLTLLKRSNLEEPPPLPEDFN